MLMSSFRLFEKGLYLLVAIALIVGMPIITTAAETHPATPATQPATPLSESKAPTVLAPGEPPLATEVAAEYGAVGDANIGRALFTGETRFTNGGPPCISCHSAGVGALGGGILGPNLTKKFADPSKNPLFSTAWVNGGMATPMGPIFANRNITDAEMLNLRAFFKAASEGEIAPSHTGTFAILGLGGFVGMLVLFSIVWSGRYSKRSQNTAHDALWRNYGGKGGR